MTRLLNICVFDNRWGGQSDKVFTYLGGDFMKPRIDEVRSFFQLWFYFNFKLQFKFIYHIINVHCELKIKSSECVTHLNQFLTFFKFNLVMCNL